MKIKKRVPLVSSGLREFIVNTWRQKIATLATTVLSWNSLLLGKDLYASRALRK